MVLSPQSRFNGNLQEDIGQGSHKPQLQAVFFLDTCGSSEEKNNKRKVIT